MTLAVVVETLAIMLKLKNIVWTSRSCLISVLAVSPKDKKIWIGCSVMNPSSSISICMSFISSLWYSLFYRDHSRIHISWFLHFCHPLSLLIFLIWRSIEKNMWLLDSYFYKNVFVAGKYSQLSNRVTNGPRPYLSFRVNLQNQNISNTLPFKYFGSKGFSF